MTVETQSRRAGVPSDAGAPPRSAMPAIGGRRRSHRRVGRAPVFQLKDVQLPSTAPSAPSRDIDLDIPQNRITALIGPSGMRQEHAAALHQPHERPRPERPRERRDPVPRRRPVRPAGRSGRGPPAHRHGVPEAQPVPQVDLRQRRVRAPGRRATRASMDELVEAACAARRSGTRSRTSSSSPARRSRAASSSACASPAPSPCSRRHPDGRALLRARPGATLRIEELMCGAQAELHHRDRDPQHAAGRAGVRRDGVPDDGRRPRRLHGRAAARPARSSPTPSTS